MFGKGEGWSLYKRSRLSSSGTNPVAYQTRFEKKIRRVATLAPFSFTRLPRRRVFSEIGLPALAVLGNSTPIGVGSLDKKVCLTA